MLKKGKNDIKYKHSNRVINERSESEVFGGVSDSAGGVWLEEAEVDEGGECANGDCTGCGDTRQSEHGQ